MSKGSDFYAYRRAARKRLKATGSYVPPAGSDSELIDSTTAEM